MPSRPRRIRRQLREALDDADSVDDVFDTAEAIVRPAIGAGGGAWSTIDPATMLGTSCKVIVALGDEPAQRAHDPQLERLNFELEWEDAEPNTFAAMLRDGRVAASLRLDVDDVRTVPRFGTILEPLGATDEARALLATPDGKPWGTAVLYRFDDEPFEVGDVEVLAAAAPVIGTALRGALLDLALQQDDADCPGSMLLGADDQVLVSSAAAEELLSTIDEHHARTALASLAIAVRRRGPRSTRVTGRGGTLVLHATPAKGLDEAISVVVERPRPICLAPLIVEALGVTDREREVVELTLQGFARAQIGARLGISVHTVGDLLKRIYDKAHVASRAELCALVFGSFYEPRWAKGLPGGPYGFFLEAEPAS